MRVITVRVIELKKGDNCEGDDRESSSSHSLQNTLLGLH